MFASGSREGSVTRARLWCARDHAISNVSRRHPLPVAGRWVVRWSASGHVSATTRAAYTGPAATSVQRRLLTVVRSAGGGSPRIEPARRHRVLQPLLAVEDREDRRRADRAH